VPSLTELMTGHLNLDTALIAELDEGIDNDVLTRMY
jgi:hypothetical protein